LFLSIGLHFPENILFCRGKASDSFLTTVSLSEPDGNGFDFFIEDQASYHNFCQIGQEKPSDDPIEANPQCSNSDQKKKMEFA
jgi:hypothetical protein